jgi:serine/threonine protein kinase
MEKSSNRSNKYFIYNNLNTQKANYRNLKMNNKSKVGEGLYGEVFRIINSKNRTNNNLVVKQALPYDTLDEHFTEEIEVIKHLSQKNITARMVYVNYEKYYYVMEKMDYTLTYILNCGNFSLELAKKLINLLIRLAKTKYRHRDLHGENIMYSNKLKDFRIIDWGNFEILKTLSTFKNISSINLYHKKGDIHIKGSALNSVLYYIYIKKIECNLDNEWTRLYNKLSRLMNIDIDKELIRKWYNIFGTLKSQKKRQIQKFKQSVLKVESNRKCLNLNL